MPRDEKIVVMGCSGHGRVVIDIVEKEARYEIVGLIDTFRREATLGYEVLGTENELPNLAVQHSLKGIVIAIGDNHVRSCAAARVNKICPALNFVSAVHPNACLGKETSVGIGTVIMAGAVVNPRCQIGRFCIVNTKASLDHDSEMCDFSSLAPGATTGGDCRIGNHSAIGIGAILHHGISIGEHSVVGSSALVLANVDPFCVAYGTPARKIRSREIGEKYL